MPLTQEDLLANGLRYSNANKLEGNYYTMNRSTKRSNHEKVKLLTDAGSQAQSFMEIGFNMGHSSNSMREINPDITESVHFDLCKHEYVKPNFDMYADNYKNAELVCGNSLETVPQYIQNNRYQKRM